MKKSEYTEIIRKITKGVIAKRFPGIKQKKEIDEVAGLIAKNVHARLYGANVDGVDSPLWQMTPPNLPDVDATKLLEE